MVFSSVPVYLDPPNWHQPIQQQVTSNENLQLPPFPPATHIGGGGGVSAGSIRPGSMADRARLAKIQQPEAGLKCPRCDSTNTKFCYFNNYSLSQPRHFCKTCRRYWTRGGALRNVPVGGGCRRSKKNKSQSSSKSPVSSERQMSTTSNSSSRSAIPQQIIGQMPQQPTQFPFITSLHNLHQFGGGNTGLNFGGIQGEMGVSSGASGQTTDTGFQIGSNSGMSGSAILSAGGGQQFPFFEPPPTGLYPFQSEGVEASSSIVGDSVLRSLTSSSRVSQSSPVKMEENKGLNLSSRPFLGILGNNQYWVGSPWTDLSGLNSASSTHLL